MFTITRTTLTFYFQNVVFLNFQKTETSLFLYQHLQYVLVYCHQCYCRPRWLSGYHTRHWVRGSRVRSRPRSINFFQSVKILSMTSFGREVKPLLPCRRYTTRKKPKAEIRASEQNLSDFSRSMSEATLMT